MPTSRRRRRLRASTAATATALVASADGAIARMLSTIPGYAAGGADNARR